ANVGIARPEAAGLARVGERGEGGRGGGLAGKWEGAEVEPVGAGDHAVIDVDRRQQHVGAGMTIEGEAALAGRPDRDERDAGASGPMRAHAGYIHALALKLITD